MYQMKKDTMLSWFIPSLRSLLLIFETHLKKILSAFITGRTPRRHNIATRPSSTSSASINKYFKLQPLGPSLRQVMVKDRVTDLEEHQKGWRMMP